MGLPSSYLSAKNAAHRRRWRVCADGAPEDVVQFVVVVLVSFLEVHARRARGGGPRGHPGGRVLLIERNARLLGGVRGRGGLALEGGGHGEIGRGSGRERVNGS